MRRSLTIFALLLAIPSMAVADPRDDAEAAYTQFFTAFAAGDQAGVVALFAPDAQFWGTSSRELVLTTDGVRTYFTALQGPTQGPVAFEPTILMLSDEVALVTSVWQYTRADGTQRGPFRNTVVLANRGQGWQIVQFHNSPVPAAP